MLKIKQMWISVNRVFGSLFGPANGPVFGPLNGYLNGPVNGPLTVSVNDSANGPVAKQEKRPTIFDESFSADMNKKLRKEESAVCVKLYETLSASTYKEPLSRALFILTSFLIYSIICLHPLFPNKKHWFLCTSASVFSWKIFYYWIF